MTTHIESVDLVSLGCAVVVDLIVEAVAVGAAAGVSATATAAVTDAYGALKDAVLRHLRRTVANEVGGSKSEEAPDQLLTAMEAGQLTRQADLREALIAAGAADDPELVAAAERLLALVEPDQAPIGKYYVNMRDNTGVQVGDGNVMNLNLGDRSERRP